MESIEILKIRIMGIVECIRKYTTESSITNIIDNLTNALSENKYEIILFSCKEIEEWYQKNITKILSNSYVINPDRHKENLQLIKNIICELEDNEMKYRQEFESLSRSVKENCIIDTSLENLINRFHQIVIQLRKRHDGRNTLNVKDEYDVQDLLHALLKIYCNDIRPEEWTPSYAGTSSRQDFLLKEERIVIEIKMTRNGLNNRKLADELSVDIVRYKAHPDCKKLICFVYDPESRIDNPRGFENDFNQAENGLPVIVYIRP